MNEALEFALKGKEISKDDEQNARIFDSLIEQLSSQIRRKPGSSQPAQSNSEVQPDFQNQLEEFMGTMGGGAKKETLQFDRWYFFEFYSCVVSWTSFLIMHSTN